jgi:hypothetical protein
MAQQPSVGQVLLIEASVSHTDTPHSVGLLWMSDQPYAETSTRQHTTFTRARHPYAQRDLNPKYEQASGRGPTKCTHYLARHFVIFSTLFFFCLFIKLRTRIAANGIRVIVPAELYTLINETLRAKVVLVFQEK